MSRKYEKYNSGYLKKGNYSVPNVAIILIAKSF
jgi:hypothetical protein